MPRQPTSPNPLLEPAEIHELHAAILSASLIGNRGALMVGIDGGFVAGLDIAPNPAAQIMLDLDALSKVGALADGTVPLEIWLGNAAQLASSRVEAKVFTRYRDRLLGSRPACEERSDTSSTSATTSSEQLLDDLGKLLPAQLEMLIFKLKVPVSYLSGPMAPPATRSIELLRWAEQSERLADVARVLAQVSGRTR